MIFQKRLKKLRLGMGLLQKDLAQKLNMSSAVYNNYELGKRTPDIQTIKIIADFFNCSTDYLLGKVDDPNLKIIEKEKLPEELSKYVDYIAVIKDYDVSDISPEELKYAIEFAKKIKGK